MSWSVAQRTFRHQRHEHRVLGVFAEIARRVGDASSMSSRSHRTRGDVVARARSSVQRPAVSAHGSRATRGETTCRATFANPRMCNDNEVSFTYARPLVRPAGYLREIWEALRRLAAAVTSATIEHSDPHTGEGSAWKARYNGAGNLRPASRLGSALTASSCTRRSPRNYSVETENETRRAPAQLR